MAFNVIQADDDLQFVNGRGEVTTLTVPTGVTLRTDIPPRFLVSGRTVVLVNTPDQPLTIDETGTVRFLCPTAPATAPILTGPTSGSLSGTFKVKYTFIIRDDDGRLIAESDFSPVSNTLVITSKIIHVANLEVGPAGSIRRLYRTSSGTDVFFPWFEVNGSITIGEDDLADAGLETLSAPVLGGVPYLSLVAEFRDRLFGVSHDDPDHLRYTETGTIYSWPADNEFPISPVGSDHIGATALISRRDALGIAKNDVLLQLTGTDDTDFRIIKLSENVGVSSQESVVVYRDRAYFLWRDGVYRWADNGIECLSDGKVRSWFTTDTYFNRALFSAAFATLDPVRNRYRLYLASAGSTTIDSWVELDLTDMSWWGPHTSDKYTPTSAFTVHDDQDLQQAVVGVDETAIVIEQDYRSDGDDTAIPVDAVTAPEFLDPDVTAYWGELSVLTRAQNAGGTLTVTPTVGEPDDPAQAPMDADLSVSRNRMGRLGMGRCVSLEFTHATAGQKVEIAGYEINPVNPVGRR